MDQGEFYRSYFQYQQLLSGRMAPSTGASNQEGPPAFFLPPQLLSDAAVSNQEGPPAFFLPPQPLPPMMGGAIDSPVASYTYYVADDGSVLLPLPQQQLPGGDICAGEGGGFVSSDTIWADANDGGAAPGGTWGSSADQLMFVDSLLAGNDDQQMHDGGAWGGGGADGMAAPGGAWHAAEDTSMLEGGFLQQGDDHLLKHGGGVWQGGNDGSAAAGVNWAVEENPPTLLGNGQLVHGGALHELTGLQECLNQLDDFFTTDEASFDPSSGLNQPQMGAYPPVPGFPPPATDLLQPGSNSTGLTADSPGLAQHQQLTAYPQPPAAPSTVVPQAPEAGVEVQMFGVAQYCGKAPSTVWSEEEDRVLLQRLSQFAGQDNAEIYTAMIALGLPNKTARDVACRIRYLNNKKAVEQAELSGPGRPAAEQVITTGKETEGVKPKYDKYSKEAVDSKSTKDIIRDNDELMDLIEETLERGQLDVAVDLFHNVKINIDALPNKISNLGSIMERLSSGLEDILRASSVGKDTTMPP